MQIKNRTSQVYVNDFKSLEQGINKIVRQKYKNHLEDFSKWFFVKPNRHF